ncbi:MAG: hypothetical protein AAGD14_15425, partial [Planctomycetota bacterium]
LFGPPRRVVELDVRSAYLYEFSRTNSAGLILVLVNLVNSDQRFDRIWFFFDSRDVLTHFGTQFSAHRTMFAMPWVDTHSAERKAKMDAKKKRKLAEQAAEAAAAQAEAAAEESRKDSGEDSGEVPSDQQ